MLPNFLIVGAAKSGTTSLYYYLQQHPEISFPKLKEPKYFSSLNLNFPHKGTGDSSVDKFAIKNLEAYKEQFINLNTPKIGEASPDYLYYYKSTPIEIKNELGDVPIIIILRNPIKRAFSAYSYLVRDSREKLSFREALNHEDVRKNNNFDFVWSYKSGGLYYEQVKAYMDCFSNVKVIVLEEFLKDKEAVIKSIFDYLKVNVNFKIDMNTTHNVSGMPTNFFAKFLLSRNNSISQVIREILKKYVNRGLLEKVSSKFLAKEYISEDDASYLNSFYKKDIENLETLLNKDLSVWKS